MAKCAIRVELVDDNYTELKGEIAGPPDTPYEGGTFVLEIKVPETYPFNPPKVSKNNYLFRLYVAKVFQFLNNTQCFRLIIHLRL